MSADRFRVTAILVNHDGARWLPNVLDGIAHQTRTLDGLVVVDTGSTDGSCSLFEGLNLVQLKPRTPFATAIQAALDTLPPQSTSPEAPEEWIWILHDDSAPAPDALERLLAAATPDVAVLGPKLREWPSLRRLLEVGVTISGTGRRETGLERGEYDQGQHDERRQVLAVNTAGMLVRRTVLAQLGFDRRLPVLGTDVDFGWRAARAGERTLIVPDAVVFHAEAARRGLRRTRLTGRRYHRVEREAALYTLLVDGSLAGLPLRLVRLFLGSLLRAVGFLLVRSPGEALDEVLAVLATYLRPWRIVAGRLSRRRTTRVRFKQVRPLLPPAWLPYRHGLDMVGDVVNAVVNTAYDVNVARRERIAVETGPIDEETESIGADTGVVARIVTSPVAWVFLAVVAVAVAGMRGHLAGGPLSGGALLPAPDSASHWWGTLFATRHDFGIGTTVAASPYLVPFALAGSLLLGHASLVVSLLVFFVVPLAAWGGFRLLRLLGCGAPTATWGAVAYGLYPVLSGAVQQGRIGTLVVALGLPWLLHAAVFLTAEGADRRRRAAFRTALWLAALSAFAPLTWLLVVVLLALALAVAAWRDAPVARRLLRPGLAAAATAALLLLPWAWFAVRDRGVAALLLEAGQPASGLIGRLMPLDLLAGRAGETGSAPYWLSAGLVVAAVAALVRRDTRPAVLGCWVVTLLGIGTATLLSGRTVVQASTGERVHLWVGVPLLLSYGAMVVAVAVVGTGLRARLASFSFGWRQPVGLLLVVVAVLTPLAGLGWWAWKGTGDVVTARPVTEIPEYMTEAAVKNPAAGVLVVQGSRADGFAYQLVRARGIRLGDETVLPVARDQAPLTDLVGRLVSGSAQDAVAALARERVGFVYAPGPVDAGLAASLDGLSGVSPASSPDDRARAWQLDQQSTGKAASGNPLLPWLVGLECLAMVVVAVFAAPTRARMAR